MQNLAFGAFGALQTGLRQGIMVSEELSFVELIILKNLGSRWRSLS